MRNLCIIATSLILLFNSFCNAQESKTVEDDFELTPQTANPKAKKLLVDEFYWSPIDETGPFGNDDGSDAFYGFREWRLTNAKASPVNYLKTLIKSWQYPPFDLHEMDTLKISQYIHSKTQADISKMEKNIPSMLEHFKRMGDTTGKQISEAKLREMLVSTSIKMGGTYLEGQDNAIIAIGFGQFVLEGKIDEDIKELTKIAIRRELLPIMIERWDGEYRKIRIEQLTKMLAVVDLMNK